MVTYKIDFLNKDEKMKELSDLVQLLHSKGVSFYFAFNRERFNGTVFIITKNDISHILLYVDNINVRKELLKRIFPSLIFFKKGNINSFNKSSIKNYIKKNYDNLEKANFFEEFISLMGYNTPKELHKIIFEEFSMDKSIEEIALSVKAKLVDTYPEELEYLSLVSSSNKNLFKIFLKKEELSQEDLNFKNNSSYGLIKVEK